MKSFITIFLLFIFLPVLQGQIADSLTLFMVSDEHVTVGEFGRMFRKNNNNVREGEQNVKDYLQLFINFKLKVHEARELGYDTLPSFRKELAGYREQLVRPYLVDPVVMDCLVREAYDHMKKEINASHILVRINSPGDTAEAYRKIMEVRRKILAGIPFETMARAVSDDASAKSNGGNLGYFTALQMIYPFEEAVYSLKPGEISMPVRTGFGYHLIRINDIRPNPGTVHVAHIMVAVPRSADGKKQKSAREKIFMIYERLKKGEDFSGLAKKYSDDYNSAPAGGVLPWFGSGKMIPEFERAAFALQHKGDISEPVRTSYGWHIIRLLGKKELGSFKEMKPLLKKQIAKSDRVNVARDTLVRHLISRYHARADTGLLELMSKKGTLSGNRYYLSLSPDNKQKVILRFDSRTVPLTAFYNYLQKIRTDRNRSTASFVRHQFKQFMKQQLLDYKNSQLEKDYPEFAALMKEYYEGMLMFDIMNKNVWSKAVRDTVGLKQFYEKHINRYMTGAKMIVDHYTLSYPGRLKKVLKDIRKRERRYYSDSMFLAGYNINGQVNLTITHDTLVRNSDETSDSLPWKNEALRVFRRDNRYDIFQVKEIIPPRPMPLDQLRGMVTSDYQDYLEKQWINELRKKYPVTINHDIFKKVEKELE